MGVLVPVLWRDGAHSGAEMTAFFRRAEELGFGSLWVPDRLLSPGAAFPHPLTVLAMAAAVTQRIKLGTAVLITTVRHPVETAHQAASVDALSGGRLTLGVGLGGRDGEYGAMGVSATNRLGRFVEGVRLMRTLWSEEEELFQGRHYTVDRASMHPRPAHTIALPFGGRAPAALRRAGRLGDGWIQGGRGTAEEFAEAWATVTEAAAAEGRDPAMLMSGKLMYANPGADAAKAEAEVREQTVAYYGAEMGNGQTLAVGSPDEMAAVIRSYVDAGAQTPMLGLPTPDLGKLERLALDVVPLV